MKAQILNNSNNNQQLFLNTTELSFIKKAKNILHRINNTMELLGSAAAGAIRN
ncbi:hypothetical protein SAMN05444411_105165 [Lutibacter oricola]|uniref:Uncharacterized protein n=1 Tax=Lutibacter oricola TaxID=762486 RepID=A0A1H3BPN1_9FLAO|nr:hypothetical protein [Lutibacter oricola]SDX43109.1 hypothetical protein SAMN05444411_105165 [Lutibacter oricola]